MPHADIDPTSKTWRVVRDLLSEAIKADQVDLEQPRVPERTADTLRGRLGLARDVLALAEDDDEPQIHDAAHIV